MAVGLRLVCLNPALVCVTSTLVWVIPTLIWVIPTLVRVTPPSFVSPCPRLCLLALRVTPPSFASLPSFTSLCPHLHLPTLVCVSPTLVVCRSPPCLHRGLLVVCRFRRCRCCSRRCCFCFCCCGCACTRPRSKCPPGLYPAVLCSPSLLAVIQVPVKE